MTTASSKRTTLSPDNASGPKHFCGEKRSQAESLKTTGRPLHKECRARFGCSIKEAQHLVYKNSDEIRIVWDYKREGYSADKARREVAQLFAKYSGWQTEFDNADHHRNKVQFRRENKNLGRDYLEHLQRAVMREYDCHGERGYTFDDVIKLNMSRSVKAYYLKIIANKRRELGREYARLSDQLPQLRQQAENGNKIEQIESAETYYDIDDRLRGWNHGYAVKIPCNNNTLMLVVERIEDVEWLSRRHHWPKKRVLYRATLIDSKLRTISEKRGFSRRGKWFEKLCSEWRLNPNIVSKSQMDKRLKKGNGTLLSDDCKVYEDKEWKIYKVTRVADAQKVSRNSAWCTKGATHAEKYVKKGLFIAYKNGVRYAMISGDECRNVKNNDVPMPGPMRSEGCGD